MNPDFAIILNFNLNNVQNPDYFALVKLARNIGARAISANYNLDAFKKAAKIYSIHTVESIAGLDLTNKTAINALINNRKHNLATVINVPLTEDAHLNPKTREMLITVNDWMHLFGHAFNQSQPSSLKTTGDNFILENRHQPYQKYLYLKAPYPQKIIITGLDKEPNRVEMIDHRTAIEFSFSDQKLTLNLAAKVANNFPWQIIRLQAHRPEDDIKETKF